MAKHTPAGNTLTDLILETFRLNGELLNAGNLITKPHGLSSARWQVMGAVHLAAQPLTVAQIARRMGLARQGVQRIVNDLRALGMVELSTNFDHKRASLVTLTAAGEQTLAAVDTAQLAWVNKLSTGLSERQLKQTLLLLQAVRRRCEELN